MVKEVWKPILGFEGYYEVSNLGNVRSVSREKVVQSKNQYGSYCKKIVIKGKQLKLVSDKDGYKIITAYKGSHHYTLKVHREVAKAFLPNPQNLPQVNHKDENKANNSVDNLEWCTCRYNVNYGNHNSKISKALSYGVIMYNKQGEYLRTFVNASTAAKYLGYKSRCPISECCRGELS